MLVKDFRDGDFGIKLGTRIAHTAVTTSAALAATRWKAVLATTSLKMLAKTLTASTVTMKFTARQVGRNL